MVQIIMLAAAWLAVREGPRLIAAAIAVVLAYLVARRAARTSATLLNLAVHHDATSCGFDRKAMHKQRQALRADMRAAMNYTQFASLFPEIALTVRGFRSGASR